MHWYTYMAQKSIYYDSMDKKRSREDILMLTTSKLHWIWQSKACDEGMNYKWTCIMAFEGFVEKRKRSAGVKELNVKLTSGGRGFLPPFELIWFSSQTSTLQNTSSTYGKRHTKLILAKGPYTIKPYTHTNMQKHDVTHTVKWTNSWLLCLDSHVGCQQ